jgi:two-component system sensor histidine kinase YesM
MKLPLRRKLVLVFSTLFAVVLSLTALFVLTRVKSEIDDSLRNNLDNTSDLIKRIVEVSVDNNWGQIAKNLSLAEFMVDGPVTVDLGEPHEYLTFNEVRETRRSVSLPALEINGRSVSENDDLVKWVQARTGGLVAIYQTSPLGFVSVSSTIDKPPWQRGIGSLIPTGSPLHDLLLRNRVHISRDYFLSDWYLTAHKLLYGPEGEIAGALFVAIKQVNMTALREDILSISVGASGVPYIMDIVGNVVIHPELEGENLRGIPHMRQITFERNGHIEYVADGVAGVRGERYIATFKHIPAMNWIVIAGSSEDDFFGDLYILNTLLLLVFALAIVATVVLSALLGGRITKPIGQMKEKIKEISEGEADLSKHLDVQSDDEVGDLARYFNTFMSKLRNLKEVENREVELQLRDAQMNALQAQINPHFLYNTLETIRFMILMKDERAQEIVKYLADLFRVSIGKGERYVRMRRELEHVGLYIAIQKMRYSDRFTVRYDVDEELNELYTLKFLLQPIVENAIHHGFELVESGGIIEIRGRLMTDHVEIVIRDNGSGMSRKQLSRIRSSLERKSETGSIGLINVYERIHLHFGARYGFTIDSRPHGGTTVTLVLPILRGEPRLTFAEDEQRKRGIPALLP